MATMQGWGARNQLELVAGFHFGTDVFEKMRP